ncbi:MAG: pilus assembly protein PilP [Nitrospinaceae bacterium]
MNLKSNRIPGIWLLITIFIAAATVAGDPALAAARPPSPKQALKEREKSIEKLFRISGLGQLIRHFDAILYGDPLGQIEIPPEQITMVKNIMNRVYEPGHLVRSVKKRMRKTYQTSYVPPLVRWYQSSTGKKIVQQEIRILTEGATPEQKRFTDRLQIIPPTKTRLDLAERLEGSRKMTDFTLDTALSFIRVLFPFNDQFKGKSYRTIVHDLKEELFEPLREEILHSILYAYRDLTDAEFAQYVRFTETRPARWLFQSLSLGTQAAMKHVAREMDRILSQIAQEIESGNGTSDLLNEIAPPGQRYIFVKKRDPFKPLVDPLEGVLAANLKDDAKMEFRKFADELRNLPPIPLEVFKRIREDNPKLYSDLEYYGELFSQNNKLARLEQEEYIQAVQNYKNLIQDANSRKSNLIQSPIQKDYDTLKLVGFIWKQNEKAALVETDDNKGHTVKEGDLIGPNFGIVDRINNSDISVLEQARDYLGNILSRKKEIDFDNDSNDEE